MENENCRFPQKCGKMEALGYLVNQSPSHLPNRWGKMKALKLDLDLAD